MDINATLIGQTIAMIVFVWFCMKFIWPPLLAAIEERQEKIAQGLAAAEQSAEQLDRAKAEADEIVADAICPLLDPFDHPRLTELHISVHNFVWPWTPCGEAGR